MSHRAAPYGGFAGMVEKVPDRQGESEIRAVLAESAQREIQNQIGWLSLRFGCRIKAGGCKCPFRRITAARNADCVRPFEPFGFLRLGYT